MGELYPLEKLRTIQH